MAHFYDHDGKLHTQVLYADPSKGMRDATLADARKLGWAPSVTGVLNERDKPQLDDWRIYEALKVALPMGAREVTPEVMAAVKRESEQYRDWSAEFGSEVHHLISRGIQGLEWEGHWKLMGTRDVAEGFLEWMHSHPEGMGLQVTASEVEFYSSLGYGGTIDILGTWYGKPCICDIKTQDYGAEGDRNARATMYDPEWPLQMAAYDIGYNQFEVAGKFFKDEPLARISFVLSRSRPGLITPHEWTDPERYDAAWLSLWDHWQAVHRWGKWAPNKYKGHLSVIQGGLDIDA